MAGYSWSSTWSTTVSQITTKSTAAQPSSTVAVSVPSSTAPTSIATFTTTAPPPPTAIPLTTIFTPPPSCLSTITYDGTSFWQGGVRQLGDHACYPPSFTAIYNSFYSPGICPYSWTSVGTIGNGAPVTGGNGLVITNAMCCPDNYYLSTGTTGILRYVCATLFSTDLPNVFSTSTLANDSIPANAPLITIRAADVAQNTIYADVIQVVWESTDSEVLRLLTATSRTPTSTSSKATMQAPIITTISSTQQQPTPAPAPARATLSPTAKLALSIALPVAFFLLILFLAGILIHRYRRRRRRRRSNHPLALPQNHAEMTSSIRHFPPAEMEARFFAELPGSEVGKEMDCASTGKSRIGKSAGEGSADGARGGKEGAKAGYEIESGPESPEDRKWERDVGP